MSGPRYTCGDKAVIAALFLVYLGLVAWAVSWPREEGAPVPAVHQGRLG